MKKRIEATLGDALAGEAEVLTEEIEGIRESHRKRRRDEGNNWVVGELGRAIRRLGMEWSGSRRGS